MQRRAQQEQQQELALCASSTLCGVCGRTTRLVGRERPNISTRAEVLTFDCECGQMVTHMTHQ